MIRKGKIIELIKGEDDIFPEARKLAHKRRLLISSPIVLTRACKASPFCIHCSWRAPAKLMKNYPTAKTTVSEAVSRAVHIEKSGVGRIFLVSGWMKDALPEYFYECVAEIRKNTRLEIVTNFGGITKKDLVRLKDAGIDTINCALETTNVKVFNNLKPGDDFGIRLQTLRDAKETGFKTCTNLIIGIGETIDDIDDSIRLLDELDIDFLSVSAIQPTPFTETEQWERPKPYLLGRIGAAARLCLTKDIDLGMSFDAVMDLAWGMKCGANAFTLALRNTGESPELLGDDISRAQTMWKDYSAG